MKRFLTFIALFLFSCAHGALNDNGDFQVWNQQSFKVPLTCSWSFRGSTEFRYGDNASFFFLKYYEGNLIYQLYSCIDLTLSYQQLYSRSRGGESWAARYIPFSDFVLRIPLSCWSLQNRFRVQYVIREHKEEEWVFRDKLTLETPWSWTCLGFKPYFAEEVFFRKGDGFVQNRLTAGLVSPYSRNFKTRIYYLFRQDKHGGSWSYQNILGVNFIFAF